VETNEARVYFALDGDDFDPDDITELLGIEPTNIRRKGSKIPDEIPKMNSWELSTSQVIDECIDIFDMSMHIVNILKPALDVIIEAKYKFDLKSRLQVVLTLSSNKEHSTSAIGFEAEVVAFLGAMGAFIDIDTYKH